MKLLIATGLYAPEIGGPATYTKLLDEKLPAAGYEVSVLPFSVSRPYPKVIRHVHYAWRLWRLARSVDIVYAQDTVSVGLPALLVAKLRRKPFVIRVPGDYAWEQSVQRFGVTATIDDFQTQRQTWRVRLLQFIQCTVVTRAALVITPSQYFQKLVGGWGVAPEKNITIYNGVDLNVAPTDIKPSEQKTIVTAGRLVAWKGITGLLTMLESLPDWRLVIVGDGPDRAALVAQVAKRNLTERVLFTGSIPRADVLGWCVAADVFVLNTHFESFSYQVVEAMHSGTPVIVTNVGSLPELITSGIEGVLVTPDDLTALRAAVLSVESESDLWAKRTAAAQTKVKTFSIENCMQRLDTELQKLV